MRDVELYCGDCLTVLKEMKAGSVDAVVTDPPYGLGLGVGKDKRRSGGRGIKLGKKAYASYEDSYENFVNLIVPRLTAALRLGQRGAVFTGPHIWEQAKADAIGGIYHPCGGGRTRWGFKNFLPVLFYGTAPDLNKGSRPTVLRSTVSRQEQNGHPCPKPLEWMIWLIQHATRPGETVLDPFAGSGTTGVACVQTGRKFIGIEIDPTYFGIMKRRITEAQAAASPAAA